MNRSKNTLSWRIPTDKTSLFCLIWVWFSNSANSWHQSPIGMDQASGSPARQDLTLEQPQALPRATISLPVKENFILHLFCFHISSYVREGLLGYWPGHSWKGILHTGMENKQGFCRGSKHFWIHSPYFSRSCSANCCVLCTGQMWERVTHSGLSFVICTLW